MLNRSVPVSNVLPHVVYQDVAKAIDWLTNVFGFSEHYRYGPPNEPAGAQIYWGNAWIMLEQARPGRETPAQLGAVTGYLTIFVDDVDGHFARAQAAGAKILETPHEPIYGERQYKAEDLAGHHWLFSRHAKNINPSDWGALVSPNPITMTAQVAPMLAVSDGKAAIAFYQAAFGATVLWSLGGDGPEVAGLSIQGAPFFLAHESPQYGTRSPSVAGFTTVRIELFTDDPVAVHKQALAAGAVLHSPVEEHTHPTVGRQPIKRMLQGAVVDPFGHLWLVGKFLE